MSSHVGRPFSRGPGTEVSPFQPLRTVHLPAQSSMIFGGFQIFITPSPG